MTKTRKGSPGQVVQGLRAGRHLSQAALAARLADRSAAGRTWTQSTIARIETGKTLRLDEGAELAAFFGVPIEAIATGDLSVIEQNARRANVQNAVEALFSAMFSADLAVKRLADVNVTPEELRALAGPTDPMGRGWALIMGLIPDKRGAKPPMQRQAAQLMITITELVEGLSE